MARKTPPVTTEHIETIRTALDSTAETILGGSDDSSSKREKLAPVYRATEWINAVAAAQTKPGKATGGGDSTSVSAKSTPAAARPRAAAAAS